jgi:hypothetical protein
MPETGRNEEHNGEKCCIEILHYFPRAHEHNVLVVVLTKKKEHLHTRV